MRTELLVGLLAVVTLTACEGAKTPAKASAAKVEHPVQEGELATVKLSEQAEQRLGITTALIELKKVPRLRQVAGEVMVPTGRSILASAPMAGTVLAPPSGMLAPGTTVKRGQVILRLLALPSAADIAAAETRVVAAQRRAVRNEQLLKEGAVAERANEDAQAELALAEANLAAARPRGGANGRLALAIESPRDGVLRDLRVGDGQPVAGGSPLFQVDALDEVWVRVGIYAGDVDAVGVSATATVRTLTAKPSENGVEAKRISAPPSADPLAVTVDLFFSLSNTERLLLPGQRVMVSLPLDATEEHLVAPWSSVIHDIHGGAWIYEARGPQTYTRRRVEVLHRTDDAAVLVAGPPPGAKVVTAGVAELFGVEFGAGK